MARRRAVIKSGRRRNLESILTAHEKIHEAMVVREEFETRRRQKEANK